MRSNVRQPRRASTKCREDRVQVKEIAVPKRPETMSLVPRNKKTCIMAVRSA